LNCQAKKQYLKQYIELKREYDQMDERYRELKSTFLSIPAQVLDDMPKGSKTDFDKIGRSLAKIEGLEDKKVVILEKYISIEKSISGMDDPTERTLMRLRYLDGLTMSGVAEKIGYVERHANRIHGRALLNIEIVN